MSIYFGKNLNVLSMPDTLKNNLRLQQQLVKTLAIKNDESPELAAFVTLDSFNKEDEKHHIFTGNSFTEAQPIIQLDDVHDAIRVVLDNVKNYPNALQEHISKKVEPYRNMPGGITIETLLSDINSSIRYLLTAEPDIEKPIAEKLESVHIRQPNRSKNIFQLVSAQEGDNTVLDTINLEKRKNVLNYF